MFDDARNLDDPGLLAVSGAVGTGPGSALTDPAGSRARRVHQRRMRLCVTGFWLVFGAALLVTVACG